MGEARRQSRREATSNIQGASSLTKRSQLLKAGAEKMRAESEGIARYVDAVVVNCGRRKSLTHSDYATPVSIPFGTQLGVQSEWLRRLQTLETRTAANAFYTGRGFGMAVRAAAATKAPLYIASAGLGLVSGDTQIPAYGLTVAGEHPEAVATRVCGPFDPASWFESMMGGPYSRRWLDVVGNGEGSILIGLTQPYARMLGPGLGVLRPQQQARLRLFGLSLAGALPKILHPAVAPYDERLNAILPGTRSDFANRALLHFAQTVLGQRATSDRVEEFEAVNAALDVVKTLRPPCRPRRSDPEITALIHKRLSLHHAKGQILRALRDEEGVACEQARFARLYRAARQNGAVS